MKKPSRRKFSQEDVLKAIANSGGVKLYAATLLGCSRTTLDKYLAENKEYRDAMSESMEGYKDELEMSLRALVKKGNVTATIFALKTICKDRGYVERIETTGQQSVQFNFSPEDTEF